ncbi:uncharacterized protein METZ01_LOCUS202997, partial [marine metagenome]
IVIAAVLFFFAAHILPFRQFKY